MVKTYVLVNAKFKPLPLPLMTLTQAEQARATLAKLGKEVWVVNARAE